MKKSLLFEEHCQQAANAIEALQSGNAGFRQLSGSEIDRLCSGGCSSDNWSQVLVYGEVPEGAILRTSFSGSVWLDFGGWYKYAKPTCEASLKYPVGRIENSRLQDCFIGQHATVLDCTLISSTFIEPHAQLIGSTITNPRAKSHFGVGSQLKLLNEISPFEYLLAPGLTLDDLAELEILRPSCPDLPGILSGWSIIGSHALVEFCRDAGNLLLDYSCRISNALSVNNAMLLSRITNEQGWISCQPSFIETGGSITNGVLQPGSSISSSARANHVFLMDNAALEQQASVNHSIIGPGTHIGQGEVHASIVGPMIAQHHQSLLIACDWRKGRGNIGYGANLGANHSSRLPDQSACFGEGQFFGLNSAVQFPGNLTEAPYSILAISTTLKPQRICLPFSLIISGTNAFNRIIPAWNLENNIFLILRTYRKMSKRWQEGYSDAPDWNPFRSENRAFMHRACELLTIALDKHQELPSETQTATPNSNNMPLLLGEAATSSFAFQADIAAAVISYQQAIRFGELLDQPSELFGKKDVQEMNEIISEMLLNLNKCREKDRRLTQVVHPASPAPKDDAELLQLRDFLESLRP